MDSIKEKVNQDRGVVLHGTKDNEISIFGVFDGHGQYGAEVTTSSRPQIAQYSSACLPPPFPVRIVREN